MKIENQLLIANIRVLVEMVEEEMAKLDQEGCDKDKILGAAVEPHDSAFTLLKLAGQVMTQIPDQQERSEFVQALADLTKRFAQVSGRWHQIVDTDLGRNWKDFYA